MQDLPEPLKNLFERYATALSAEDTDQIEAIVEEANSILPDLPMETRYWFNIQTAALVFDTTPEELDAEIAETAGTHDLVAKMACYEGFEKTFSEATDKLDEALTALEASSAEHAAAIDKLRRSMEEADAQRERDRAHQARLDAALRSPHLVAGPGPLNPQ